MTASLTRRAALVLGLAATALGAAACTEDPAPQFVVTGTGTVAGRLFYDADNNGRFSPVGGDTVLANVPVEVRARGTTRVLAYDTSDVLGLFSFEGVPAGTQELAVTADPAITGTLVFCGFPSPTSVYANEEAYRDVAAKLGCVIRVQAAEALAQGSPVTVRGAVTAIPGTFRSDNLYLQDQTSGIQVFGTAVQGLGLQLGDTIEVTGVLGNFGSELQVNSPRITPNIVRGNPAPTPRDVLAGTVKTLTPTAPDIGRLVRLRNVRVSNFTSATDRDGTATDATGATLAIRLDNNAVNTIPPLTSFVAGKCYDLTGILSFFSPNVQLKPRTLADVVEVPCS